MKHLLLAALFFLVCSAGTADAAPVIAAIQAIAAFAGSLGVVGSALLQIAIGSAMSMIAKAKMRKAQRESSGIQTDVTLTGGANSETFIIGYYGTAGTWVCPPLSRGDRLNILTYVIDLAGMPGHSLEEVFVNGERLILKDDIKHGVTVSSTAESFKGLVSLTYFDGSQTEAPDLLRINYGGDPDFPWSDDMVGRGRCYVIVEFKFDDKVFSGLPSMRFGMRGVPLFDPRDGNVVQSDNLALQVYSVLRGFTFPDGSRWGGEASLDDLPLSVWAAAMNEADRLIETKDGESEPQFRGGFEVRIGEHEPAEVLERLMDACTGDLAEEGGTWYVRMGAPPVPSAFLTDDDLIVDAPMSLTPFAGLADSMNSLTLKYPNPSIAWEVSEAERILRPDLEAQHEGRRLSQDLSLSACPFPLQVQRVGQAYIRDAQRDVLHSVTLPPDFAHLPPLSVVSWTSDHNQYEGKHFSIEKKVIHPHDLLSAIEIREVNPADHSWSTEDELPVPSGVSSFTPISPFVVSGARVEPIAIRDSDGKPRRVAVRVSQLPEAISIEWRVLDSAGEHVATGVTGEIDGAFIITSGILPEQTYFIGLRAAGRENVDWSEWYEVETQRVRLRLEDIDDSALTEIQSDALSAAASLDQELVLNHIDPLAGRVDREINDRVIQQSHAAEAVAVIGEQVLWALTKVSEIDGRIADAGVYTDPSTGQVRIYGVDASEERIGDAEIRISAAEAAITLSASQAWVDRKISEAVLDPSQIPVLDNLEARVNSVQVSLDAVQASVDIKASQAIVDGIEARLNSAEVDLDAASAALDLKVERAEFDDVSSRLGQAEVQIGSLDGPVISQTVSQVSSLQVEAALRDQATLADLLASYEQRELLKTSIAFATQDIRAKMQDDRIAEAKATTALSVAVKQAAAKIDQEAEVRAEADQVLANDFSSLEAVLQGELSSQGSALSALTVRVSDTEGEIATQSQQLTQLEGRLVSAEEEVIGQANAVSQLSARVIDAERGVTSQAAAITNLETTVGDNQVAVQQAVSAVDGVLGEYTLRIDNNGRVSGMVLRSDLDDDGVPSSEVVFQADKFAIGSKDGETLSAPFVVYSNDRVIDGMTYPAGVYLERAYLGRAAVGRAQIADVIESNNFSRNAKGVPKTGLRLDFKKGVIEAADVSISRPMVLATGAFQPGGTAVNGSRWAFVNTGIRVGKNDVWRAQSVALVAAAAVTSSATAPSGVDANNTFWSMKAEILPGARWFGFPGNPQPSAIWRKDPSRLVDPVWASAKDQRLFLAVSLEAIGGVYFSNPTIEWTVFQVT